MVRTAGGGAEFSSCNNDDDCCKKTSDKCRCKKVHNYYQWVAYILVLQVTKTLKKVVIFNLTLK